MFKITLVLLLTISILSACSTQGFYEGFRHGGQKQCERDGGEDCSQGPEYIEYKDELDKLNE
jgi:hypothetical protein